VTEEARLRDAVRALVVDDEERVLLARFRFAGALVWATPGGGIEAGEGPLDALRRELLEEVGLADAVIGPVVWTRTHVVALADGYDGQRESIHLVRCAAFDPDPALSWDGLRAEGVTELRWWTLDELDASAEVFAPRRLAALLRVLLRDGPTDPPVDSGV
jgi:8-oxo-dGTP pyrophosphatase MutT (NUDIX family)